MSDEDLARDRAAYESAIDAGVPVVRPSAERLGFWLGVIVSSPIDFLASGLLYLGELVASATASAPLLQLARLTALCSRLLDAPFSLLRRALQPHAVRREREVSRDRANFLRVPAGPRLPINAASEAAAAHYVAGTRKRFDTLIVPGFADDAQSDPLSRDAAARLDRAASDLAQGLAHFVLVTGGNVHPPGTPYNEAVEMRRYLIERHHVALDRILVEPFAEHTPTNLRNAGRLMRSLGLQRGLITSSLGAFGQMHVFHRADSWFLGLHPRALIDNGTLFGRLAWVDFHHCAFFPDDRVDLVKLRDGQPLDET